MATFIDLKVVAVVLNAILLKALKPPTVCLAANNRVIMSAFCPSFCQIPKDNNAMQFTRLHFRNATQARPIAHLLHV